MISIKLIECSPMVGFLHSKNVYHHCTMIVNWWLGVKYVAGDQGRSIITHTT